MPNVFFNSFLRRFSTRNQWRRALQTKSEVFWQKEGEKMALALFHSAARHVPAYGDFLKKNKIKPETVQTTNDFKQLPLVDKKNYLQCYALKDLCWKGKLETADVLTASSGSSGEPFFWPRGREQEKEAILSHELFLTEAFDIDRRSTLFIVAFAMGLWVAGTLTYRCVQAIAERYPLTVITPGINKEEIVKIIKRLGGHYQQVVLAGYPPLIKDVIDEGRGQGLDWSQFNLKFLLAAEAISESWRDYLYQQVKSRRPLKDCLNIYGTADALIIGHETPLSIFIRRQAARNRSLHRALFSLGQRELTLVQYNPALRFLEDVNGQLVFSAFSGIPLVRYNIGDEGGVINFSAVRKISQDFGLDWQKAAQQQDFSLWPLPFAYVLGRKDFTATLYGVNIYPENIKAALEKKAMASKVSGKFVMITKHNHRLDQYLEINVELAKSSRDRNETLGREVQKAIVASLRKNNSEFRQLHTVTGLRAEPVIILRPYEDKHFFTPGIKQKWHQRLA